jgi:hypothetical protein
MSTTLANITTLINDRRRSSDSFSVDMTQEGFRAIDGTLQIWNQEHDWPWQLQEAVFNYNNGNTTYPIPASWDFKAIVNIRPQKDPRKRDELYYVSQNKFDSDSIHSHRFAVKLDAEQQQLRCQYEGWRQYVDTMASYNTNGTWIGSGAISTVATDQFEAFTEPSSISFSYSGTSGALTNSTLSSIDLSRYLARSVLYLNVNLQSVTNFTGITIKVGSSSSNYVTISATTDYLGNAPVVGWNKFAFSWTGTSATVGTPVYTAITYAQITIAYSGNPSSVMNNIENFFVSENVPMVVDFYTNNMVVQASDSSMYQIFQNAANTTDYPMWNGTWDFVNEPFINSCMEIVSSLTGERDDEQDAFAKVQQHLEPLKARLPSKRRYPQFQMTPDLNGSYSGTRPPLYRNYPW